MEAKKDFQLRSQLFSRMTALWKYGLEHPILSAATLSFVAVSAVPIVIFLTFTAITIILTTLGAIVWESFLVICGLILLAVALSAAVCVATCCSTGVFIIYQILSTMGLWNRFSGGVSRKVNELNWGTALNLSKSQGEEDENTTISKDD